MNILDLKMQVEDVNALGRHNLTEKGVTVGENATTYDIMTAIAEITGGSGGIQYTNIVYNENNTITLTDKNGVVHTMICTYENDMLVSVTYDGKAIELVYDGDVLVSVGNTTVDIANAPKIPATNVQTTVQAESSVAQVILPVIVPTVTAEINSNIIADSSASLEE